MELFLSKYGMTNWDRQILLADPSHQIINSSHQERTLHKLVSTTIQQLGEYKYLHKPHSDFKTFKTLILAGTQH